MNIQKGENKKIDNIEKLVEIIATNVLKLTDKVDNIETNVLKLTDKVDNIETNVVGIKNQLEGTNKRIDDLAMNRVKYEDHNKLKVRIDFVEEKLEIKKSY